MTRLLHATLTFFTVSLNNASSAFALDFWQPPVACYGQAIGGHDQTLFINLGQGRSVPLTLSEH